LFSASNHSIVWLTHHKQIAMPISFGTGFGLHWDLYGLWAGPALALALVSGLTSIYIYHISWDKASEEAVKRNEAG
jgi:MATE family multidrug resistance protein